MYFLVSAFIFVLFYICCFNRFFLLPLVHALLFLACCPLLNSTLFIFFVSSPYTYKWHFPSIKCIHVMLYCCRSSPQTGDSPLHSPLPLHRRMFSPLNSYPESQKNSALELSCRVTGLYATRPWSGTAAAGSLSHTKPLKKIPFFLRKTIFLRDFCLKIHSQSLARSVQPTPIRW